MPRLSNTLLTYFLRGLVVTAPLALTLYICWAVFVRLDRWIGLPIPGAGFVLTLALITLAGILASNLVTRSVVAAIEQVMRRLPFVRLLYTSTKDLLNAFVGEQRRFDRPVIVALTPDGHVSALGFITADSLAHLGLGDLVAVYVPQSYNVAGNLLLLPAHRVRPIPTESAEVMAFIISGGVSGLRTAGTR